MNARTTTAALFGAALLFAVASPGRAADLFGRVSEKEVMGQKLSGKLSKVSFPTPALGGTRTIYIYTPPGYDPHGTKTYPVTILMHGSPGTPLDWPDKGDSNRVLDRMISAGSFPATILVLPDGRGPHEKGGSDYADDIKGTCKMETSIARDLVGFLKGHYKVSASPDRWALAGCSEGGFGAANLVVRHPDLFRIAIDFSGDVRVRDSWGDDDEVFGASGAFRLGNCAADSFGKLAPEVRKKLKFYIADSDGDDDEMARQSSAFVSAVKASGGEGVFVRERADFKWGFWQKKWGFWQKEYAKSLPTLARWLSEAR